MVIDEKFQRPAEVDLLVGDSTKARATLGWLPTYDFDELIQDMVKADLKAAESNRPSAVSSEDDKPAASRA